MAVISSRFSPETSPGAKRATDLTETLSSCGHRVTVLTQMPNYPDPSAFDYEVPKGTKVQVEDDPAGYTMWRFAPEVVAKENLVGRLRAEARFAWRVSKSHTRLSDLDGVIASTPFVFNLAAARSYRVPMWLDVRDLTWEYARDLSGRSLAKQIGANLFRRIALSNLRAAQRVSTTTESQRQYLIDRGLSAEKVVVIPNGVPRRVVETLGKRIESPHTSGGALKVVYAGLLGFAQGLEFAVKSVEELADHGIELHLFGDGVDREPLQQYCSSRGVRNVFLHGHVSYDKYLDALASADVLFTSLRSEVSSAMPSKIWEYMAAAKPILFVGEGEAANAIAKAKAGISAAYGETQQLRECLQRLKGADLRQQWGTNGREWVLRHQIREDINQIWVEKIANAFVGGRRRRATELTGSVAERAIDFSTDHGTAAKSPTKKAPLVKRAVRQAAKTVAWGIERSGFLSLMERSVVKRSDRLAVLTYHRVVDHLETPRPCPGLVSASPASFANQIAYIAANWRVVSMAEVLRAYRDGSSLPARALLLTFDDAYRDFATHAWPVLKYHQLPVTLFVPTGFPGQRQRMFWWDRLYQAIVEASVDRCSTRFGRHALQTTRQKLDTFRQLRGEIKTLAHSEAMDVVDQVCSDLNHRPTASNVLSWDALRELAADGVTLGCHTRTHPLLDKISPQEVRDEVVAAQEDLKREIGEPLPIFAYPAGHYDDQAVQVLADLGMELAFTTHGGVNDVRHRNEALTLNRIHVGPSVTRSILRLQLLGLRAPNWLR